MRYFDVHTHQSSIHQEDIAVINKMAGHVEAISAEAFPRYFSCGIHPWYINDVAEQLQQVREWAAHPNCVAIGEAGFDKFADSSVETQREVFLSQAVLAEELRKPLIIHCVKWWAELLACKRMVKPTIPWVIHGFRGNGEMAAQLIKSGCYLSVGEHFHPQAVRAAWPERLLAETDDKEIDIRVVYQKIEEALGISEEEVCEQLSRNVMQVYKAIIINP